MNNKKSESITTMQHTLPNGLTITFRVGHINDLKKPQHPCSGKCTEYRNEQCKNCLVGEGA